MRHQLFHAGLDGRAALRAAVCYSGAYAENINTADPPADFALSPADLDEAVSALLDQAGSPRAYGARGSTGLSRIQDFVRGYQGPLSAC